MGVKAPGLVGEWPFEAESGGVTLDTSGNPNDGTVTGATAGTGQMGKGYTFTTDDVIVCGDDTSLDVSAAVTITAWIKLSSLSTLGLIAGRDAGGPAGGIRSYYMLIDTNDKVDFTVWIGNSGYTLEQDTALSNGVRYFLASVYDGTDMRIYLDGLLDVTPLARTGSIDNDDVSFSIGARNSAPIARFFEGDIDEVRVWSRALAPGEIRQVMQGFLQGGM